MYRCFSNQTQSVFMTTTSKISKNEEIFRLAFNEYTSFDNIEDTRIRSDFMQEIAIQNEYLGREIYELIQNADDQEAERLVVNLDTHKHQLSIKNDGEKPFTIDGFRSIMRAHTSAKLFERLIGNKGLGFRSILNWADVIEIRSAGVICEFSQNIADYYWNEIKKLKNFSVKDILSYERMAKKENRSCPIPILSIPKVSDYDYNVETEEYAAEIFIKYKDEEKIIDSIKNQLESLGSGSILLFLPHLKQIEITIDDKILIISKKHKTSLDDSVNVIDVNDEKWLVMNQEGFLQTDNPDSRYQVSIAYKRDSVVKDSNKIYCFFPTKEINPFNCIIHGTFKLDQSRNHIIDDQKNRTLKEIVAETMLKMALFVSHYYRECDWEPFSIVYSNTNEQPFITNAILSRISQYPIFPTLYGKYIYGSESEFVSNQFSEIFLKLKAKGVCFPEFESLLMPFKDEMEPPFKYRHPSSSGTSYHYIEITDLAERLDNVSADIPDYQYRVDIIKILKGLVDKGKLFFLHSKPHLLVDNEGNVIKEKGYFYSSENKPIIPSCINLHYVDDELFRALMKSFSAYNERFLSSTLENVLDVVYCDKNRVVNTIVPNSETDPDTIVERIQCLWEFFKNGEDISVSDNTNVVLFNENDEVVFARSLVLYESDYPDGVQKLDLTVESKWLLAPTTRWNIQTNDYRRLQEFWLKLGVCKYIPLEKRTIVDDTKYLDFIGVTKKHQYNSARNHSFNQTFVPIEEYVNQFNLSEILCLISKNTEILNEIRSSQQLCYVYYTDHHVSFKVSYLSFYLQQMREIKKLHGYVVAENVSPTGIEVNYDYLSKQQIKRAEVQSLISYLGAVDKPEDLSVDDLYQIVRIQYSINKEGRNVARIYSMVKKALNMKLAEGEDICVPQDLMLYAKMIGEQKGKFFRQGDVYYWDNDQMPKSFLKNKPKLDIGSRVGEEMVKQFFGIKLAKEHMVTIVQEESEINQRLTDGLARLLKECSVYILAFRNENVQVSTERKQNESAFARLQNSISCYVSCRFLSGRNQVSGELFENEMIVSKNEKGRKVFNICSKCYEIDRAIRIPEFCDAIVETIAIVLKIKSDNTDFLDRVREILKNNHQENECLIKRRFGESATQVVSGYEKRRDVVSSSSISDVQVELMKLRDAYKRGFQHYLYDYCDRVPTEQLHFRGWCKDFNSNEWLMELSERIVAGDNLEDEFYDTVYERYRVHLDEMEKNDDFKVEPLPEYDAIMPEISAVHMEDEDKSLLFFSGNEKKILELVEKYHLSEKPPLPDDDNKLDENDFVLANALWSEDANENKYLYTSIKSKKRGKTKLSSARRIQIGETAEDIVCRLLKNSPKIIYAEKISETSDKAGGTDKKHYDIEYIPEGESIIRHLEVKSMQGNSCILTQYEYEEGKNNPDIYDIAFVRSDKVYILKKPFAGDLYKDRIWPSEYTIDVSNLELFDEMEL